MVASLTSFRNLPLLVTALFEPDIAGVETWDLPRMHREGTTLLARQRVLDIPQAVALAGERAPVGRERISVESPC